MIIVKQMKIKNKDSFFPLNQETNFKINKYFRTITKNKKKTTKTLNIKGRVFEIKNFYEGISRLNFKELCDQNLGAEDYLEITDNSSFMVIENIPEFNDINSNQQLRFITLLDIIYDKNIPIVMAKQNIDKLTSSRSLEKQFKRTISRLYELTSKSYNNETKFFNLKISTNGQKLYELTDHTVEWINQNSKMD